MRFHSPKLPKPFSFTLLGYILLWLMWFSTYVVLPVGAVAGFIWFLGGPFLIPFSIGVSIGFVWAAFVLPYVNKWSK